VGAFDFNKRHFALFEGFDSQTKVVTLFNLALFAGRRTHALVVINHTVGKKGPRMC
jgi:hypothetical protein